MQKLIIKIVLGALTIFSVFYYIYHLNTKITDLNDSLLKYKLSAESNKAAYEICQKSFLEQEKSINSLSKDLKLSEDYNDKLSKLLSKHNLTYLASKKPKLIERRINNATKKVFSDIAEFTSN